jgi:hypothetical protein
MKLFDETHPTDGGDSRTLWYKFENDDVVKALFSEPLPFGSKFVLCNAADAFLDKVCKIVRADLAAQNSPSPGAGRATSCRCSPMQPVQTSWIFYTDHIDPDAIDDKVRFTVCVRYAKSHFDCNINTSDFIFATSFDAVANIKQRLETLLNS